MSKVQEANSTLTVVFALSKWPHLHRESSNRPLAFLLSCTWSGVPNYAITIFQSSVHLLRSPWLINPRVKPQAKGQNYFSIALKWGIVCLFKSSSIGDMIKNRKCQFFGFSHFLQFCIVIWQFFYKNAKIRKLQIF